MDNRQPTPTYREDVFTTILQVEEKSFDLLSQQYESEIEASPPNEDLLNKLFQKLVDINDKSTAKLLKKCASATHNRSFNNKQISLQQLKRLQQTKPHLATHIHFLLAQCYESYGDQQNLLLAMEHQEKTERADRYLYLKRLYRKSADLFDVSAKIKGEKIEPLAIEYYKKAGSLGDIEALLIAVQYSKQEEKSDLYASAINFAVKFAATLKKHNDLAATFKMQIKSVLSEIFSFINKYSSDDKIDSSISRAFDTLNNPMLNEYCAKILWEELKEKIDPADCPISFKYMDNILSQLSSWCCTEIAFLHYAYKYYTDQSNRNNESFVNELNQRRLQYHQYIEISEKIDKIFKEAENNKKSAALNMIALFQRETKDPQIKLIIAKETNEFIRLYSREEEILQLFARENHLSAIEFLFNYYQDLNDDSLFKIHTSRPLYLAAKICLLTLDLHDARNRFALSLSWLKEMQKKAHAIFSENTVEKTTEIETEKDQANQYTQLKDLKIKKLNKYELQAKYFSNLIKKQNQKNAEDPDKLFLENPSASVDIRSTMTKIYGKEFVKAKVEEVKREKREQEEKENAQPTRFHYPSTASHFRFSVLFPEPSNVTNKAVDEKIEKRTGNRKF